MWSSFSMGQEYQFVFKYGIPHIFPPKVNNSEPRDYKNQSKTIQIISSLYCENLTFSSGTQL